MRKIVLTFGLIAGGVLSAMLLITLQFQEQIGFDKGAIIGYTTMVLAFLMVYFGVRSYRDSVLGGQISFGKAFGTGLLITLVATACYVATWEAIYFGTASDFADKYAAHTLEKARAAGATEAQLATQAAEMAKFKALYQNPLVNIALTFLEPMPVGLLFTLITAALLSRRPRAEPLPAT